MRRSFVIRALFVACGSHHFLAAASLEGAAALACDLPCYNGATCQFGDAPSERTTTGTATNINNMYCDCPLELWTGLQCNVPVESCGGGSHSCYNGGECVEESTQQGGHTVLSCKCGSDANGNVYFGKYCQHVSTAGSTCQENPQAFCFNGGVCNDQYPDFGDNPCLCDSGHTGSRCEYRNGDDSTPVVVTETKSAGTSSLCNLPCQNGGSCKNGQAQIPESSSPSSIFWKDFTTSSTGMYCSCLESYDGPLCEVPRAPCGNTGYCYYGSTCVEKVVGSGNTNQEVVHHCDCTTANTNSESYAGRFCQYRATQYCTKDPSLNDHLFCVNDGRCRNNVYEGCDCPDGFTGISCELHTAGDDTDYVASGYNYFHDPTSNTTDVIDRSSGTGQQQQQQQIHDCGEHLCLHGGQCVEDEMLCDCDEADSQLSTFFAGLHCEHPVTQVCTEGAQPPPGGSITFSNSPVMPGTPLSFCVNGGTCKATVGRTSPHPGCYCPDGFLGPHCELREAEQVPNLHGKDPYTTRKRAENPGSDGGAGFQVIALILSLVAFLVVAVFGVHTYRRRRRLRSNHITNTINWSSQYRDRPSPEVNIAPKRGSVYSDIVYEQATESAFARSSRDPMAEHLSPTAEASTRQAGRSVSPSAIELLRKDASPLSDGDEFDDAADEPQVYIGPPRDEDGHELHNVEIV